MYQVPSYAIARGVRSSAKSAFSATESEQREYFLRDHKTLQDMKCGKSESEWFCFLRLLCF